MISDGDWRVRLDAVTRRLGFGAVPPGVVAVGVLVLAVAVAFAVWRFWPVTNASEVPADVTMSQPSEAVVSASATADASSDVTSTPAWVHVVGAVRRPGVYELPSGSRVADAIEVAGGLLGNGAAEGVNMARPIADGEQIAVPTREEWKKAGKTVPLGQGAPNAGGIGGASAQQGAVEVDLNSADAAALDTLPGIGPSTAQKIVADREANGPFASPEDLGRVSGIGPRKLEALKGLICAR